MFLNRILAIIFSLIKKHPIMNGKIIFASIPQLNDNWQLGTPTENPANVWTVWDEDNYYLWGANGSNIFTTQVGAPLMGGGMASVKRGPTRGLGHPHYIGVNTMEFMNMSQNDTVFRSLTKLITSGKNVVVPIYHDHGTPANVLKYSLGTGIGASVGNWADIQKHIFNLIIQLSAHASAVDIPAGVYWPDCRNANRLPHHPITSVADIQSIVDIL